METLTPLDPVAQAFENQLVGSPTVKKLHRADEEIIEDLEEINVRLDKGDKRMGGIEGKVEAVDEKVDKTLSMIQEYDTKAENRHKELSDKVVDNRYQDIKEEKNALKKFYEDKEKKRWELAKIAASVIISAIATYLITKFG